jgi:hypothetical protein
MSRKEAVHAASYSLSFYLILDGPDGSPIRIYRHIVACSERIGSLQHEAFETASTVGFYVHPPKGSKYMRFSVVAASGVAAGSQPALSGRLQAKGH